MRKILMTVAMLFFAFPCVAQGEGKASTALTPVKPEYVCMMNNTAFDKLQIAVDVDGKTYYGCCPMCKERLAQDASMRTTTDPVSGKKVDKASAVIGKAVDGRVFYFENEAHLRSYVPAPKE
ncbi:MAG: hypothetical protein WBK91_05360 [Alphaproteobacteria bacterium]